MKDFKERFAAGIIGALIGCVIMLILETLFGSAVAESNPEFSPVVISEKTAMTWEYLGTITGCTAATILISQFLKFPLDKVWKIPTRIMVYAIALIISVAAGFFLGGKPITISDIGLDVMNSFLIASAAYGAYEVTIGKEKKE